MKYKQLFILNILILCIVCFVSACKVVDTADDVPDLSEHIHGYVETIVPPTCTEQGYTTYTCTRCGDTYVDNYIAALGHDFGEWKITKEPTCTGAGIETRVCSRDETHTETREVPATGVHNYVNGVCSVCGKIEVLSVTFYLEDGETVYYSITVNAGESVLLPTEEPKDAERRKEFKGWGKKEGDVFSETAYEFADGGTMLADVRENMEFRALFGENIYTPICP